MYSKCSHAEWIYVVLQMDDDDDGWEDLEHKAKVRTHYTAVSVYVYGGTPEQSTSSYSDSTWFFL